LKDNFFTNQQGFKRENLFSQINRNLKELNPDHTGTKFF